MVTGVRTHPGRRIRRTRAFGVFLLFLHLVANYTVLEYFGGNPELGIVSYRHIISITASATRQSSAPVLIAHGSLQKTDDASFDLDADDCLASCTHCIQLAAALSAGTTLVEEHMGQITIAPLEPDPHLLALYRPPRVA